MLAGSVTFSNVRCRSIAWATESGTCGSSSLSLLISFFIWDFLSFAQAEPIPRKNQTSDTLGFHSDNEFFPSEKLNWKIVCIIFFFYIQSKLLITDGFKNFWIFFYREKKDTWPKICFLVQNVFGDF